MYVERKIKEQYNKVQKVYNAIAIVGPRQSGKTTFLKEQTKLLKSSYVLFDDPDARTIFEKDVKKFETQYLEGYDVAVLDEVQYCKEAGTKLKYLVDKNKKILITSSSEVILSKEILSYLVGRVSIIKLYPFSLSEFLSAKNQKEITSDILERNIWEHINYGGYPKVVITQDSETKKIILKDLYETMTLKDIAQTFSIEDIRTLEEFTRYLSANIGSTISYEKVANDLKMTFQTIKKYLDAMEKSYLITRISPFYKNKSKELIKQPKIYFIDTGLRNTIAREFKPEIDGFLFENYVLTELIKLGFSPKYWRTKTKAEVDFIIEKDSEIIPIEVKINSSPNKIERSLKSFIETYKPKKAVIVTYKGTNTTITISGCKVTFTNVLELKKILS